MSVLSSHRGTEAADEERKSHEARQQAVETDVSTLYICLSASLPVCQSASEENISTYSISIVCKGCRAINTNRAELTTALVAAAETEANGVDLPLRMEMSAAAPRREAPLNSCSDFRDDAETASIVSGRIGSGERSSFVSSMDGVDRIPLEVIDGEIRSPARWVDGRSRKTPLIRRSLLYLPT